MLDKVCILPAPGWPLRLAHHIFSSTADGQLAHFIDGDLRATVPPEGWADYVREWPDAAWITDQLRRVPAPAAQDADAAALDAAKWAGTTTDAGEGASAPEPA